MTPRDVDKVLDAIADLKTEVAVLNTRLGASDNHGARIRRLELVVVAIVASLAGDALGVKIPFS